MGRWAGLRASLVDQYGSRVLAGKVLCSGKYIPSLLACTFDKNSGSRDPIFGKVGQRSRSQEHMMYIAKICLNSVPAGPINFILRG